MHARTVAVLAYEGAQVLDVMGPAEVFFAADAIAGDRLYPRTEGGGGTYRVRIVSVDGRDVLSSSGLRLGVQSSLAELEDEIDTLIVPGSHAWSQVSQSAELLAELARAAERSRRVASVCAGAFMLGAVGLLDGRRATTHWMFLDDLAERFPAATVDRRSIFVGDGRVFTCAGATAGIDLALGLVEADHGAELAREVARFLVVFMQRPGSHAQFSVRLRTAPVARPPLRALLDAIAADPAGDYRLSTISAQTGFSERHLTRVFVRELGLTPARYVEQVRVEAARALLEQSDAPLAAIARQSGLGSAESLRRAFGRDLGATPDAYRQRFRTTGVTAGAVA
jgi:transcriptional regulator GlxA family with amidase domain